MVQSLCAGYHARFGRAHRNGLNGFPKCAAYFDDLAAIQVLQAERLERKQTLLLLSDASGKNVERHKLCAAGTHTVHPPRSECRVNAHGQRLIGEQLSAATHVSAVDAASQ